MVCYRWGLVPSWAMDAKAGSKAFNARAETLATSPLFRDPFKRRRCLVPVDGFYEWRRVGSTRTPVWIHDPSGSLLALAGLWTGRQDPETGDWRRTFTIITTRPNDFMVAIHDRMPVVITRDAWARWLDPAPTDPGELRALLEPREDVALDARAVSLLVNNVRNDGPELIEATLGTDAGPGAPEPPTLL